MSVGPSFVVWRSRQDTNLRGETPLDFESNSLYGRSSRQSLCTDRVDTGDLATLAQSQGSRVARKGLDKLVPPQGKPILANSSC